MAPDHVNITIMPRPSVGEVVIIQLQSIAPRLPCRIHGTCPGERERVDEVGACTSSRPALVGKCCNQTLSFDHNYCMHGQGVDNRYHGMTQRTRYAMYRPPINTKPDFHLDRYLE